MMWYVLKRYETRKINTIGPDITNLITELNATNIRIDNLHDVIVVTATVEFDGVDVNHGCFVQGFLKHHDWKIIHQEEW